MSETIPFRRVEPDPDDLPAKLTELRAAERFVARCGDEVRFDHRRQRWLVWQGHRWVPSSDGAVERLAVQFLRRWQHEALDLSDSGARKDAVIFAMKLERRDGLSNLLALAKVLKPIADNGESWDRDPMLLGVPNGVIDLRTGDLRAGYPVDRITMSAAVPCDPEATCPRWLRFLDEVFDADRDLINFVARTIGYALTGETSEQCFFLCYGTGANGKGTLLGTLQRLLGDYAHNMPFSTVELYQRSAIPNDVAALVGRRFVVASETNEGTRLNEARMKALTGCDPITARFLHSEFFTYEPVAKFLLAVNHKPIVRDDSHAFWRRVRLIPFERVFDVNPDLPRQLAAEATGILAWAVCGCLAWQRDGLQAPARVALATESYREDSDHFAGFLEEACEPDAAAIISAAELFQHYRHWAERHGFGDRERLTRTAFGTKLGERFPKARDSRTGRITYGGLARRPEGLE